MPFAIETSPEIRNRVAFADLCNRLELFEAVEVGTECGAFARDFLTRWQGHRLWCVDAFASYPEMPYDRTPDLMMAVQVLAPFVPRVKIIRGSSAEVAGMLLAGPRPTRWPFVYIDGAHDYESVKADLAAWWPRVRPDGIFAGHDWTDDAPGVKRAVTEFAQREGLRVLVTRDADTAPSWYAYKPSEK